MNSKILFLFVGIILFISFCSAEHFISGIVEDARDGTSAEGKTIILWNPLIGNYDNLTEIIDEDGNYSFDCELLQNNCSAGNVLSLKVLNNGDNYISEEKNITVSEGEIDFAENIILNSPPTITSVIVDDEPAIHQNEIDLIPAQTKEVTCKAIVNEYDGESSITGANARFFDSNYGFNSPEDNNKNYRNSNCYLNYSYGDSNQVEVVCSFAVWYYANQGNWICVLEVRDNLSIKSEENDSTQINSLLAIGLEDYVDFEKREDSDISEESEINVINYGNVKINLSINGYGAIEDDGNAMVCDNGKNISVENEKYNLTISNDGEINFEELETTYENLTSTPKIKKFNLNYRENDFENEAIGITYWRIHIPDEAAGECTGNVVFGATMQGGEE